MSVFAAVLAACGLSRDEAARLLGQSESSVKKKLFGERAMTSDDMAVLAAVYERVRSGDVTGLPQGVRNAAAALRLLRGVDAIQPQPRGRKPGSKVAKAEAEPELTATEMSGRLDD